MKLTSKEMLVRLGNGETIAKVCEAAGIARPEFDAWWRTECQRRVPGSAGTRKHGSLQKSVRIERDSRGVAHVHAENDRDVFFGFGYATAQDRLFQLDYLRRKARGRLAEVMGPEAVESDLLYRTIGLSQIAQLLTAVHRRHHALIEKAAISCRSSSICLITSRSCTRDDSLAIIGEFRWYLTGRFPVIYSDRRCARLATGSFIVICFEIDEEFYTGDWRPAP